MILIFYEKCVLAKIKEIICVLAKNKEMSSPSMAFLVVQGTRQITNTHTHTRSNKEPECSTEDEHLHQRFVVFFNEFS